MAEEVDNMHMNGQSDQFSGEYGAVASNGGDMSFNREPQTRQKRMSPKKSASFNSAMVKSLGLDSTPPRRSQGNRKYRHSVHVDNAMMQGPSKEGHMDGDSSSEGYKKPFRPSYHFNGGFPAVGIGSLGKHSSTSSYKQQQQHHRRHSTVGPHSPTKRHRLPGIDTGVSQDEYLGQESPGSPQRKPLLDIMEYGQDEREGSSNANTGGSLSSQFATTFLEKQVNHLNDLMQTLAQYVDSNYGSIAQVKKAVGELAANIQSGRQSAEIATSHNKLAGLERTVTHLAKEHHDFENRIQSRLERLYAQVQVQSEGYESLMTAVEEINQSVEGFADAMEAMTSEDASRETLMSNMDSNVTKLRSIVRGSESSEGLRDSLRRIRSFSGPQHQKGSIFENQGYDVDQSAKINGLEKRIAMLEQRLSNEEPSNSPAKSLTNTLNSGEEGLNSLPPATITEEPGAETASTDSEHSRTPPNASIVHSGNGSVQDGALQGQQTHRTPQPPTESRLHSETGAVTPNHPSEGRSRGRIIRETGTHVASS